MTKLNSVVEDRLAGLQLSLDKVELLCVEEKLSFLQCYKSREIIKNAKAQKRI